MKELKETTSRAYSEFLLIPGKTTKQTKITDVDMTGRLTHDISIPLPFLSAAMQSVTGDKLAIALALQGGLGVLPCGNVPAEEQAEHVRKVKRFKSGFVQELITVSPNDKISRLQDLEAIHGYSTFPVTNGNKLIGVISEKRYHPGKDISMEVRERMVPVKDLVLCEEGVSLDEANEKLISSGVGMLPIVDKDGNLKSAVFWEDLKKVRSFPNAFLDAENKTLRVAGAVSTHQEDVERARMLVRNGVDFLVLDSSDIFSEFAEDAMEQYLKFKIPIIAGNVVSGEGFEFLANLGADCVKIGQGPGSICTTRMVKSTGRGQATAIMELAKARDEWMKKHDRYIPICADGGIKSTGDMTIAFALGADTIMMGSFFAGFTESPTPLRQRMFRVASDQGDRIEQVNAYVKDYWGEASPKAKNLHRYSHDDPRTFVIEGEEGFVLHKGPLAEQIVKDVMAIKSSISACGCKNMDDFHMNAVLELQTSHSSMEGRTSVLK